jgi:hypothetical protein
MTKSLNVLEDEGPFRENEELVRRSRATKVKTYNITIFFQERVVFFLAL